MARGETAIGEVSILGYEVLAYVGLDFWVIIDGVIHGKTKIDSVSITDDADGSSSGQCTILNPPVVPVAGNTIQIIYQGEVIFGGVIRLITLTSGPEEAVKAYSVEAGGWELLLQRRSVTKSYANVFAGDCIRDALTVSGVRNDGVLIGTIELGPLLVLVNADHVRVWDFIRDIGKAGGGVCYIDPYRTVYFMRSIPAMPSDSLNNADILDVSMQTNFDNYRNQMVIKCTSLDGASSQTATRTNGIEVAVRIAAEGGSGIYEVYQEVKHPTSNVAGDLSLYAQSVAYISLLIYGKSQTTVIISTRRPTLLRIGQFVRVYAPGMGLVGNYVVIRRQVQESGLRFLFTYDLVDSTVQQMAIQSLLRIVGAAQAAITILADIFPNSQTFTALGASTWTVPAGVISAEVFCLGAGGGGAGAWGLQDLDGAAGGNGAKGVSIFAVTPGQVYDIFVGTGGAAGASQQGINIDLPTSGADGTSTYISIAAGPHFTQGDGGGHGKCAVEIFPPADGTPGSGTGDAVTVGGGSLGGIAGIDLHKFPSDPTADATQPTAGVNGVCEVRW